LNKLGNFVCGGVALCKRGSLSGQGREKGVVLPSAKGGEFGICQGLGEGGRPSRE